MNESEQASFPLNSNAISRRGEAMRDATSRGHARLAHIRRCQAAGRPDEVEIRRMVDAFLSQGGQVQTCKPAYVLPVQNGAGDTKADVRS